MRTEEELDKIPSLLYPILCSPFFIFPPFLSTFCLPFLSCFSLPSLFLFLFLHPFLSVFQIQQDSQEKSCQMESLQKQGA